MTDEREPKRGQERRQNKPPSLELSFGPIVRAKDDTFSTTIFIGVSGWWEGGWPETATLSVGVEAPMEIHLHQGTGSYPLVGLEPESHLIVGAKVKGREVEKLLTVPALPKSPMKVAKKVYVTFGGKRGKQQLLISVSDENGNFITDAPVIIVDGEAVKELKTNDNGALVYNLDFTEPDRYVEVRAGNEHDLIWRARLNGPQPPRGER